MVDSKTSFFVRRAGTGCLSEEEEEEEERSKKNSFT
jgi:hypothetical protein